METYPDSYNNVLTAHQAKVMTLRQQGLDARTTARAYADLGDMVEAFTSKGDLWDIAQKDLVILARRRQAECATLSRERIIQADQLERRGI